MVEVNEDPIVVTLKIQRETEAAKQQAVFFGILSCRPVPEADLCSPSHEINIVFS